MLMSHYDVVRFRKKFERAFRLNYALFPQKFIRKLPDDDLKTTRKKTNEKKSIENMRIV